MPSPTTVDRVYLRRHTVKRNNEPFVSLFMWTTETPAKEALRRFQKYLVTTSLVDDEASPLRRRATRELYEKQFGKTLTYAAELMQRESKKRRASSFLLGLSTLPDLLPLSLAANLQPREEYARPPGKLSAERSILPSEAAC
jgi:hypothetical protein